MLSLPDADLVRRDPALPGLGTVLDPARFVAALRAARPELGIEAVQVSYVHYKPGRECIVGYRLPRSERAPEPSDPRALRGTLDLYAVAQRRERRERKHPAAGRAPGCSDEHRVLAFEWLAGERLSDLVVQRGRTGGEPPRDAAALAGTALAALHAQPADGLPRLARAEEARQLCARAEELAHTFPPLAERAALLAHRLAARLRDAPTAEHPIHGDFYAKQVLLDGGRVGIIDLDQAARGDPAFDLGRFIAHVERAAVRDGLPARHVADLTRAFLDGYQAATG